MRISLNWLKNYVNIDVSPEVLAEKLTNVGLEVESIDYLGKKYDKFLVGKILKVDKHPNADKLTVCKVDIGSEIIDIVCGAPNVAENKLVVVGLVGATIPRNQHDTDSKPFTLKRANIRGIESNGMICSEYELDLGEDKSGILILKDEKLKAGTKLSDYLGLNDVVFEIGITPNRPDCLSHLGIAREIAAIFHVKLKKPKIKIKESKELVTFAAKVYIDDIDKCPRYTARVLRNVKVEPSPQWLQNYLNAVGIRPINNIVDVTNYVLMEIGHPLHAFDYDRLKNNTIKVRTAKDGEHFVTLDGKGRELKEGILLICDDEKPVAIAGVMGGVNSEITETTKNILLESAYFLPQSIRRTSKLLGLSTDASQRFERGADPNITKYAINRAAELIQRLTNAKVLLGYIDIYPKPIQPKKIFLNTQKVNRTLGTNLTYYPIKNLLQKIDIKFLKRNKIGLWFEVPTFRPDLERDIDLIEEIARLYGYDNIEIKMRSPILFSEQANFRDFEDEIKNYFFGRGYDEIITNSLLSKEMASLSKDEYVEILNPISRDMATMRTSMLPSILSVIKNNIYHQSKNLNLFEIGKVYFKDSSVPRGPYTTPNYREEKRIILAKTGISECPHWSRDERESDIFDLKGEVEDLFVMLSLDKYKFISYTIDRTLTEMNLNIMYQNVEIGYIGKVKKEILELFDIEQDVYVSDINLDILKSFVNYKRKYVPLPLYPMVIRDLAFIVDKGISVEKLLETIKLSAGELLKDINLFDVYTGERIAPDKKSCAFTLQFQSEEKTLTDEEVTQVVENIIKVMNEKYNATLRK
ncbi:MAG: Phenylalanyl-tRNA synthetase beta chain [Ignavibacteriae bacterium]|nr:MAG: Phenylalanyl-tRNA synthetase beta chain [Ignavibacteriota bacterium]